MKDAEIQNLAALLEEALRGAELKLRYFSKLPVQSFDEYKRNLLHIRQFCSPRLRSYTNQHNLEIKAPNVQAALIDVIRTELAQHVYEDRIQTASFDVHRGGVPFGIGLDTLVTHLLRIAVIRGEQRAAHAFYECIERSHAPYQTIGLLDGISVWKEQRVCDGIRLVQLPKETDELPPYLNKVIGVNDKCLLGRTVIIVEQLVSPQFMHIRLFESFYEDTDRAFKNTVASRECPQFNIDDFCNVLSLVCDTPIRCKANWTHMDEDDLVNINIGATGWSGAIEKRTDDSDEPIMASKAKVQEAMSLYRARSRLGSDVTDKLRVSIERWLKSKESSDVDAFIHLGIALESLYLDDSSNKAKLSLKLRRRVARFLAKDEEEQELLMKDLKKIYNLRSEAVHTGNIGSNSFSIWQIKERAQHLCRESIIKIIKSGEFPEWDDPVFDNS